MLVERQTKLAGTSLFSRLRRKERDIPGVGETGQYQGSRLEAAINENFRNGSLGRSLGDPQKDSFLELWFNVRTILREIQSVKCRYSRGSDVQVNYEI